MADLSGNGTPDLIVGNAFGDVLVLLGDGNGAFQTPVVTDQSVGLAVGYATARVGQTLIFVDQSRDRIVVQNGPQAQPTVLADRTNGLLVPGAPVLADLSGNGLLDLIVPNTGGNNVLVYPGLPGGGFGPAMNDGDGFFTGTNPVAVVVADVNGDGRLDLIVANKGSNDISVLLNVPQGSGFTFVEGPRIPAGLGPVGLVYGDFTGDGIPDLVVSDSGSNDLMLLEGRGDGFFTPLTSIALDQTPGAIFAGPFEGGSSLDIVVLDPGTSDVTLVSGDLTGAVTTQVFSSGGFDPVSALAILGSSGFEDLVVANNADGSVALLQGTPLGLSVEEINSSLAGLNPTGLALASVHNDDVDIYATTAGDETASLLVFSLGSSSLVPSGSSLTLFPSQETSLPLVATLFGTNVDLSASEGELAGQETAAALVALSTNTITVSLGQGSFRRSGEHDWETEEGQFASENEPGPPSVIARPAWKRIMIGLDEALEQFHRATQSVPRPDDGPEDDDQEEHQDRELPDHESAQVSRRVEPDRFSILDAAISALGRLVHHSTAITTTGNDDPGRMTTVQLKAFPLAWLALAVPSAGSCLASTRLIRRTGRPATVRLTTPWRVGRSGV